MQAFINTMLTVIDCPESQRLMRGWKGASLPCSVDPAVAPWVLYWSQWSSELDDITDFTSLLKTLEVEVERVGDAAYRLHVNDERRFRSLVAARLGGGADIQAGELHVLEALNAHADLEQSRQLYLGFEDQGPALDRSGI